MVAKRIPIKNKNVKEKFLIWDNPEAGQKPGAGSNERLPSFPDYSMARHSESQNRSSDLVDAANATTDNIMMDLFEANNDQAKLALGPAFNKIYNYFRKSIESGFKYKSIVADAKDFYVQWEKNGKLSYVSLSRYLGVKKEEILPLVSEKILAKQESLIAREMAKKAKDPEVARKYAEDFVIKEIAPWLKKARPGITPDEILSSDLVQEELLPVIISGIQTASPYKFKITNNPYIDEIKGRSGLIKRVRKIARPGFTLTNEDKRHHHDQPYTLDDFDAKLMYQGQDYGQYELLSKGDGIKNEKTLEKQPVEHYRHGVGKTEEEYQEERKRIYEIQETMFHDEKAAYDQMQHSSHMPNPDDFLAQADSLASKEPAIADIHAKVAPIMDYLKQEMASGKYQTPEERGELIDRAKEYFMKSGAEDSAHGIEHGDNDSAKAALDLYGEFIEGYAEALVGDTHGHHGDHGSHGSHNGPNIDTNDGEHVYEDHAN